MQKMMNKIMLSCHKATELIEKKQELKLANREKIQLILHLKFCSACSAYQKQSEFLNRALKSEDFLLGPKNTFTNSKLSPARKEEILRILKAE